MNAKKLTMAVSFMMVLAAAFVLVVPSDSEAADGFEITDAEFLKGKTNYFLTATISEKVEKGVISLYYENETEPIATEVIPTGWLTLDVLVGPELANGTYRVVVDSEFGTVTKTLTWPAVVSYNIVVSQSQGGVISTDKATAVPNETVYIEATPAEDYKLTALYVNGTQLAKDTYSFPMPASNVTVTAVFEPMQCTVTLVIADGFTKEVTVTAGEPMAVPEVPEIIGAEFKAWCTEDGKEFDFTAPIEGDITLYAVYGPYEPITEQTSKLVASMVYDKDGATLVATAYDGNVIGKGVATVTVLQEVDFLGLKAYVEVGKVTVDFDTNESYAYQNITEEASEYITESGNYAMVADIVLDNKTTASSNYIVFDIEINEQA